MCGYSPLFDLIAFDADDTLWHNERLYSQGRAIFQQALAAHDLPEAIEPRIDAIEIGNLPYYGYGAMSFVLSMIEAAIEITGGTVTGEEIRALLEHGKLMLSAEVELYEGVEETLAGLAVSHSLMLITKGDLQHQQAKVAASGLAGYFQHVEVVSDKNPAVYQEILDRHKLVADRFLMVGNSMRSDVLPVVAIGGWALHIPNSLTWSHEAVEPHEPAHPRIAEVAEIGQVPEWIAGFEVQNAGNGA